LVPNWPLTAAQSTPAAQQERAARTRVITAHSDKQGAAGT
jgi:hypothetical protein